MKNHKLLLIGLSLTVCQLSFVPAEAQDFGIWTEANVEKKITRKSPTG